MQKAEAEKLAAEKAKVDGRGLVNRVRLNQSLTWHIKQAEAERIAAEKAKVDGTMLVPLVICVTNKLPM